MAERQPTLARGLDEQDVAEYLAQDSGFFERHPELLAQMTLQHESGRAVSLIEKQVEKLREENLQLNAKLHQLVSVARDNEKLSARMQKLSLTMLESHSLQELLVAVEDTFRSEFEAEFVVIKLLEKPQYRIGALPQRYREARDGQFSRVFKTFLHNRRVRCGRLLEDQRNLLFSREADEVASLAIVPLFGGDEFGVLALGSRQAARFQPGMGVLFLEQIGELFSTALKLRFAGSI